MDQVEQMLVEKLESRMVKLKTEQLALAAWITVANSILLGCLWYLLLIWAGKQSFLKKLQRLFDGFVWAGRSRVARATAALPKAEGGLRLLGVEQYNALTSNLILWIMAVGEHPLRCILQNHVMQKRLQNPGGVHGISLSLYPNAEQCR